ncbi:hypothetical protein J1N10_19920 [Carboxylicivirga sp. A043]|uniref:hypothetical protein n=1 Tax=Carboxylicivirga litoralis TaxID=2816963 RepID=UPI0021CB3D44|nr:hypothetical protein [Carboxylicivirga sp. A043]MCU4158251.1 hypothetical protein [Carboxylicivirga sp. A043]
MNMPMIKFGGFDNTNIAICPITINFWKRNNTPKEKYDSSRFEVEKLLRILHCFYSLPDFEVDNPTMNKDLVHSFYSVAIRIFTDFGLEESLECISRYFTVSRISNRWELIRFFHEESINIKRNDARYRLGFRGIYLAISQNKEAINIKYAAEINRLLEPFYLNYKHREFFITGLRFNCLK